MTGKINPLFTELSRQRVGEKHPRWIADRTKVVKNNRSKYEYENDGAYRVWMIQVKNRDHWKCKIADKNCNGRLEAHHILNWIDFPELRYEINNGITLCHAHHPRGRAKEQKMVSVLQKLLAQVENISQSKM